MGESGQGVRCGGRRTVFEYIWRVNAIHQASNLTHQLTSFTELIAETAVVRRDRPDEERMRTEGQ